MVDVISTLTESNIPKRYWTDLKKKLIEEGSQLYENIVRLKMKAKDGKFRDTELTNEIYKTCSDMKANEYKNFKGIRKESLIDNMTDIEVILTDLGEATARDIAKKKDHRE